MKKILLLPLLLASLCLSSQEDKKDEEKWEVAHPKGEFNYKEHEFTTDEGTWMNLDVSQDGKMLVFDLMGDIYSVPITGGKAKALRTGIPFEIHP